MHGKNNANLNGPDSYCVELYVISEYAPYTASEYTITRVATQYQHSSTAPKWLRNLRRKRLVVSLSSGLWLECSLCVGIRLVILAAVMGMEHLNYACHPQEIITKFYSFAVVFAVASHR